jgi:IclR family acetate operon transcriptional repressor
MLRRAMASSRFGDTATRSAVERTLAILDLLAEHGRPMRALAIATACAIPRSTIYRLLAAMESRGYLAYDAATRSWSVGPRLTGLGASSPTLAQTLRLLEAFDSATPRLSVAELAGRAGLDAAHVGRAIETLLGEGLLSMDDAGRVGLGLRIVSLAARAEPIQHLLTTARPYLELLRDRTGETANLLVRDGSSALYLDQAESPRALRVSGWTGRRIPLAGTAAGAALTGDSGVHVVSEAVEPGVIAVACGIHPTGAIPAAISVTAPTARLQGSLLTQAAAAVREVAGAIERALAADGGPDRARTVPDRRGQGVGGSLARPSTTPSPR